MTTMDAGTRTVIAIGIWSSILTAVCTILFSIAAVLTETKVLSAPWDAVLSLTPSLLLAPSFLALLVCVNAIVPSERKIWSQLGVVFAGVYVPLCSASYIVELFVVEPRVLRGAASEAALITIARGDSVFNAVDGLGYLFMCLAALVTAPAFERGGLQRWIRWLLLATGVVAVPIFLTYFVNRSFIYAAALWSVTISAAGILLAVFFRRVGLSPTSENNGA